MGPLLYSFARAFRYNLPRTTTSSISHRKWFEMKDMINTQRIGQQFKLNISRHSVSINSISNNHSRTCCIRTQRTFHCQKLIIVAEHSNVSWVCDDSSHLTCSRFTYYIFHILFCSGYRWRWYIIDVTWTVGKVRSKSSQWSWTGTWGAEFLPTRTWQNTNILGNYEKSIGFVHENCFIQWRSEHAINFLNNNLLYRWSSANPKFENQSLHFAHMFSRSLVTIKVHITITSSRRVTNGLTIVWCRVCVA